MLLDFPTEKPDVILFDWDNTLCDTWQVIVASVNACLIEFNQHPWTQEEAKIKISKSARELFPDLFGADNTEAALAFFYKTFEETHLQNIRLIDNTHELLNFLKQSNIICGVVSNKRHDLLVKETKYLGLDHFFDVHVGAGIAARDKPAADPILYALNELKRPQGKYMSWYIGDSKTDIIAAHNASMTCIIIETDEMKNVVNDYKDDYNYIKMEGLLELYNACRNSFA